MLCYSLGFTADFQEDLYDFISARVDTYSPAVFKEEMTKIGMLKQYKELLKLQSLISNKYEELELLLDNDNYDFSEGLIHLIGREQNIIATFFFYKGILEGLKLAKNLGQV